MGALILGLFTALSLLVWSALPPTIQALGIHPEPVAPQLNLTGKRALIITTSQGVMPETGQITGVWAAEMTGPYYAFQDAGMQVDLASIQGGEIPIEPGSTDWPLASTADQRFLNDPVFRLQAKHAYPIAQLDFKAYDLVFVAGGWGAAYDLGQSAILGERLTQSIQAGIIHGAVCHGPLGFLQAKNAQGQPLLKGMHITAVSDQQVQELGIGHTPLHPEQALRAAGALYEKQGLAFDTLATHTVVDQGIVTGQNQNSALATAYLMMQMLHQREAQTSTNLPMASLKHDKH